MEFPNLNGKRMLMGIDEADNLPRKRGLPVRSKSPFRRMQDVAGNHDPQEVGSARFSILPDDVICHILSCLDVGSLLRTRCLNRSFRTLASTGSAGWTNLCRNLWADKIHILPEARDHPDPAVAYRMSVEDARSRDFVKHEELVFDPHRKVGTVWSFRFKVSAGQDWTSWDPWFNGQPCRKMVFLPDGSVKEYRPADNEDSSSNDDGEVSLEDPPFAGRMGNLVDPPTKMSWRYITQPLDMPARPQGSYIRFTVAYRDVPTYCVRRSPTNNWGFIMESCWGVYASFELPKRIPRSPSRRPRVRLRRASDAAGNLFNVEVLETSDEETTPGEQEQLLPSSSSTSRLLIDDDSFVVTNGVQWREAFLHNSGSRYLPQGENAIAEFEQAYNFINNAM